MVNKTYGKQFSANEISISPPNNINGIEKYLSSGAISGIGPALSSKLIKAFGEKVLEIIENNPEKILEVENVGQKRLKLIKSSWEKSAGVRKVMFFLQNHGVSPSKSEKIYKSYGDKAVTVLKANPYQLIDDVSGIGFKTADQMALGFGIDQQSKFRIKAGINYILNTKVSFGHCAYPKDKLILEVIKLLNIEDPSEASENNLIEETLKEELKSNYLKSDNIDQFECIYLKSLFKLEKSIIKQLMRLHKGLPPWSFPKKLDDSLIKTEKILNLKLASLQKLSIHTALTNKITIITGGPGTGKSTLTLALTQYLKTLDVRISLCSPTGRAAKRLSECTHLEAKTIHRLLSYDPDKIGFKFDLLNPLETDIIIVDEASMVDLPLAHSLLKAIPNHAALVIIGDVDQLPSVGPGEFLKDLIDSNVFPVVKLTQIYRQSQESKIITSAHQINNGALPDLKPQRHNDFFFLEESNSKDVADTILDLIQRRIPQTYHYNPITDIQVLSPMQRGEAGVKHLNIELQKALNPNPIAKIEKYDTTYAVGDKVMITENNYEKDIFNGDIGIINNINFENQIIYINIDGKLIDFSFSELDIVVPSYAITIHKSQGSEYPVVVIPIVSEHQIMLQKNLIYTAITRGKKLVILVGSSSALRQALHSKRNSKRWTNLKSQLIQKLQKNMDFQINSPSSEEET